MAMYFFDITNSVPLLRDDIGTECASMEEVREATRRALPEIAKDAIPQDGDRQFFTVVARDADGHAVYTATMSYAGMRLDERPQV